MKVAKFYWWVVSQLNGSGYRPKDGWKWHSFAWKVSTRSSKIVEKEAK